MFLCASASLARSAFSSWAGGASGVLLSIMFVVFSSFKVIRQDRLGGELTAMFQCLDVIVLLYVDSLHIHMTSASLRPISKNPKDRTYIYHQVV